MRSSRHFHAPAERARLVHARLRAEPEHVLHLHHRHPRGRGEGEPDQRPLRRPLAHAVARRSSASTSARTASGERLVPAAHRVVVVRAGVDDDVLGVVAPGWCTCPGLAGVEAELQDDHARVARATRAAASTGGVITPRSSAISGSAPSAVEGGVERRAPRPALPAAAQARGARRAAPPSRRRSRGSGRSARGRRARTCGGSARSTSGSPRRRSAGQSYSGLPHSWPLSVNASGGTPATASARKSSGCARLVGRARARRRSGCRRSAARRARSA